MAFDEGTFPWEDRHICLPGALALLPIWDYLKSNSGLQVGWTFQSSNQSYDSVLGLVHIHFIPYPEVQCLLCRESLLLESLLLGGPEHWLLFPLPRETLKGQTVFFWVSNCFQNKGSLHTCLPSGFPFAPQFWAGNSLTVS